MVDFAAHKFVHLLEYGVLYFLYYRSQVAGVWEQRGDKISQSLLFVFIYGSFDEYHQSFVPGRSGRVRDVWVDLLGGVLAFFIWKYLRQKALRKQKI